MEDEALRAIVDMAFNAVINSVPMRIDDIQGFYDGDLYSDLYACASQAKNHNHLVSKIRKLNLHHPTITVKEKDFQDIALLVESVMPEKPAKEKFIEMIMMPPSAYKPIKWGCDDD